MPESVGRGLPRWLVLPFARLIVTVAGWRLGVHLSKADPIHWVGQVAPRPVFFIHGDRDPYVTVDDVEALYTATGEPKQLWRVADAGHRRVDQVHPAEYRESVLRFFKQYVAASA